MNRVQSVAEEHFVVIAAPKESEVRSSSIQFLNLILLLQAPLDWLILGYCIKNPSDSRIYLLNLSIRTQI